MCAHLFENLLSFLTTNLFSCHNHPASTSTPKLNLFFFGTLVIFSIDTLAWVACSGLFEVDALLIYFKGLHSEFRKILGNLVCRPLYFTRVNLCLLLKPYVLLVVLVGHTNNVLGVISKTHHLAKLEISSFYSVYTDSGLWDTFVLALYDKAYRTTFVYTILPLSENTVIEKMGVKVFSELVQNKFFSFLKKNLTLGQILGNTSHAIVMLFTIIAYMLLCTV